MAETPAADVSANATAASTPLTNATPSSTTSASADPVSAVDQLSASLAAIASPQRMRIIAMLAGERLHVSELARRVGMSRALLYMHLTKLEEAGFVVGSLELSDDGKALKFFEVVPFSITVDVPAIVAAVETITESE